ncbi:MAG: hypothetical protein M1839_004558 [Geoglossum umbratile]|nr:MAG: hypothetical protein M1839_004558 [Geoglossum umbratile]
MRSRTAIWSALLNSLSSVALASRPGTIGAPKGGGSCITPKVFIISMFEPEAAIWVFTAIPEGALHGKRGEINAATTITALTLSPVFNLTQTYFLIAGIAGINPEVATICSVTFARFAVQVALQFEFDAREIPTNFSTGYVPFGAVSPNEYPTILYGTEVFEVNNRLRQLAIEFAKTAALADSSAAQSYRAAYTGPASEPPTIVSCDVATSDVYYSGTLLSQAFANTTKLFTNGTGNYCSTAQEDNATLEALMRGAMNNLVDFSRIIVMRTASDFDRPFAGESPLVNLFYSDQGAFGPAVQNLYLAGVKVVQGVLKEWDTTFRKGVVPENYIGDIFGSLGGQPDFGYVLGTS